MEHWRRIRDLGRLLLFGNPNGTIRVPINEFTGLPATVRDYGDLYGHLPWYERPTHAMIEAANDLAILTVGLGTPFAARSTLGIAGGKPPRAKLPMDKASRHARAVEQRYSPGYWRGESSGAHPSEYPGGAYFSLDKEYAAGFARKGGVRPRPFWLKLEHVYDDAMPLTADKFARIVQATRDVNRKLANELAEQIAPGKGIDWVIGFGQANPNVIVARGSGPALIRFAVERGGADATQILKRAGFIGVHSGRDVHMFTGQGIRHNRAAFDPKKADEIGIYLGLGGAALLPSGDE